MNLILLRSLMRRRKPSRDGAAPPPAEPTALAGDNRTTAVLAGVGGGVPRRAPGERSPRRAPRARGLLWTRAERVHFQAAAATAVVQLLIYNAGGESWGRVAHFFEFSFGIVNSFVTFWFCLDNRTTAEDELLCIMWAAASPDARREAVLAPPRRAPRPRRASRGGSSSPSARAEARFRYGNHRDCTSCNVRHTAKAGNHLVRKESDSLNAAARMCKATCAGAPALPSLV